MRSEVGQLDPSLAPGPYGRWLERACKVAAIAGALVFVGLVVMSIVSISGRKLLSMPVPGDVEMLQLCAAFASSSFFAWCHLKQGDVKVDFFTECLPARQVHALDAVGSLLVGLFGALIAWRTAAGAAALQATGETTMILGAPVWLGQALMVPGFVLLALAGCYRAAQHWHGTRRRQPASATAAAAARQP
ncbi:MAG: TRAP transporter small permease [Rubrivivax sp.]|nr:TRAP transporter small permease [Rubrivivax sp.]